MKASDTAILNRIKSAIQQVDPQAEVVLFGSRARGDDRPDSDWDLLVLTERILNSRTDEIPFWNAVFPIELDLLQDISLAIRSKTEWKKRHANAPLYEEVEREGLKI